VVIRVHTMKVCVRTGGLSPRTLTTVLEECEMVGWVGNTAVLHVSGKRICPLSGIELRFRGPVVSRTRLNVTSTFPD
jgi:hypothetical protein